MASEELRSPSISLPPRKRRHSPTRTRSPPSSPEDDNHGDPKKKRKKNDLSVEVCIDHTRSACHRSELDCKFAHPHPAVSIDNHKVTACADALRNKCFRGRTCRYYHPPPHIQATLLKASGVQEAKVDQGQVCRDFLKGRCLRAAKDCRFAHHSSIDDCAVVCQDFLRGKCERKSCRYSHGQVYVTPQVHLLQYGAVMRPPSPPRTGNDREVISVCKDFLKKRCHRDECKYAHPGSQTEIISDQVEVCRDFHRGACHRSICRFYHPRNKA